MNMMPLESYIICCNDCAAWYTDGEVDYEEGACPSCGGELLQADERGMQTPYMAARAELVKMEIQSLSDRIKNLKSILKMIIGRIFNV